MKKLIFLLCIILLAAAGIVVYKNWRSDLLRKKIPEWVYLKSDSLYRITYDDVDIDEVEGEIVIKNLQLRPDTVHKKPADSLLPRDLLEVTVPEIHITGVQTNSAVLNKEIIARKIKLSHPTVIMFSNHQAPKKGDHTPINDKIYKVLLRGLEKISVDTILIGNADYHICQWSTGDTVFSGHDINAQLYNLNISDSTSADATRVLFAERAELAIDRILFRGKRGWYHYRMNDIKVRSDEKLFLARHIGIVPLMDEAAFVRAAKFQTDRLDFNFSSIRFSEVNVQELLNGNLIAGEMNIGHASFKVFRDKSYPLKKISKIGHYPHQQFLNMPIDVAIKKVVVENAHVEYKEKNPVTGSSGIVFFNKARAVMNNVTNSREQLKRNNICTVHLTCRLIDKADLAADFRLYLASERGKFRVTGTMSAVDAAVFNPLSQPMALVQIHKGSIKQLAFDLNGDDHTANGTIQLLYDDLKVKLLKKDGDHGYKKKKLTSFLANMSITNDNPSKNKPVRVVTVSHPRNIYASMFNLIWKSILEGIQKTVGLKQVAGL